MRPRSSRALGADGIVTSERDGNLRVSAHAYNTVEDIDAVLRALRQATIVACGSRLAFTLPDIL